MMHAGPAETPIAQAVRILRAAPWSSSEVRDRHCQPLDTLPELTAAPDWVENYLLLTTREILAPALRRAAQAHFDPVHQAALDQAANGCGSAQWRESIHSAREAAAAAASFTWPESPTPRQTSARDRASRAAHRAWDVAEKVDDAAAGKAQAAALLAGAAVVAAELSSTEADAILVRGVRALVDAHLV